MPWAICVLAVATLSLLLRTLPTMRERFSVISLSAASNWPVSSFDVASTRTPRSPDATARATCTARPMGCVTERAIRIAAKIPNTIETPANPRTMALELAYVELEAVVCSAAN